MENLHHDAVNHLLKKCPFCGNTPNMFQTPENRYGENAKYGWFIQCSNMGCYAYKDETVNHGDQSFGHCIEMWNTRETNE